MCESLFPCHTSVEEIRDEALMMQTPAIDQDNPVKPGLFATLFAPTMTDTFHPSTESIQGRSTCKITGALCPGITIGCAVCGIFAPATCGDTCIIAGLYCGTSGYACQYEASKIPVVSEEEPVEEVVEEEIKEEPEEKVETPKEQHNPRSYRFKY